MTLEEKIGQMSQIDARRIGAATALEVRGFLISDSQGIDRHNLIPMSRIDDAVSRKSLVLLK
uniref:Furostanol glycoside 26-O-beta-glucosidase (Fragments) n=1 Tax=Solanum torvum TaxID=119830 RepID=F26G_SOLTO|nr:RecName: Full=Furostanol glycoside 26-O-beta-glucosidase; AltName: Full=Torvosidase [Solanum torvum]